MPRIKLNGRDFEVPPGTSVLSAALKHGVFIPHLCYHPALSLVGICRLCLVKVSTSWKLEPACMITCVDGMIIQTEVPEVQKARSEVLEFMLINHPLDCPVCDKAGECLLQNFTYDYRSGLSRFREEKFVKGTKDLGPNIRLWGSRCIACTRCIRFCNEISGTGELCMLNRGTRCEVGTFPGIPLDNPLSLNTVDICPVGALINKDFLYQARVWFTEVVPTICPSCSRGCNIKVSVYRGEIKRIQPNPNPEINGYWMCDEGRLNYKYIASPKRLLKPKGSVADLLTRIGKIETGSIGFLVSTYQTNEELTLIRRWIQRLGTRFVWLLTKEGDAQRFKGGFVIDPDKTPNRRGAELILGDLIRGDHGPSEALEYLKQGKLKGLIVINGIPGYEFSPEFVEGVSGLRLLVTIDIMQNSLTHRSHVVLPGASFVEKSGTYVNSAGVSQSIRRILRPPGEARPEVDILQQILSSAGF
jgi:NADH-quinone oxidoreductase subunit G